MSTHRFGIKLRKLSAAETLTVSGDDFTILESQLPYALQAENRLIAADSALQNGTYIVSLLIQQSATITLNGEAGLTILSGASGTAAVSFSGILSDINAALNGLSVNGPYATEYQLLLTLTHQSSRRSITKFLSIFINHVQATSVTAPGISGSAAYGSTLTGGNGTWNSYTPITEYLYQWYADGIAIDNADGISYTTTVDDVGKSLTRGTRAVNDAGQSAEVLSNAIVVTSNLVVFFPTLGFYDTDQPVTLSGANKPYIADPSDAGTTTYKYKYSSESGSLTLSGTTSLTFTIGDGTADQEMEFTGTLAAINAALDNSIISGMTVAAGNVDLVGSDTDALDVVSKFFEVTVTAGVSNRLYAENISDFIIPEGGGGYIYAS